MMSESAKTPPEAPSTEQLLEVLGRTYRRVKSSQRVLHLSDRLVDDLDLDSLDAIEVLLILEDELDRQFLDELSQQLRRAVTLDDFIALIRERL
jgi:acyl carrier protein